MNAFTYHLPVRLIFGRGKLGVLGEVTAEYGRKALVVTGRNSAKKTGLLDRALNYLNQGGLQYIIFDQVESNPLTTTVVTGAKLAVAEQCDVIIGLGGGSALDAAKAIAFAALNPGDISEYIFGRPGGGALPVIAVTTTAGTGSEGDSLAVLTNPITKDKKSLKTPMIYPKASIIDSELMTTLPKPVIAATGIDVLCHAMEAFVGRRSNPVSDAMALKAIELITTYLPQVYRDPSNLDAWDHVAIANTMGGMVIDVVGVGLPHGLEHPVSGLLNVVHGEGLAALLIRFMEYSYADAPLKFSQIAAVMGENISGKSTEEAAYLSIGAVQKLLESVNLTPKLRDLGVTWEQVEWLAENSLKTMGYSLENSPKVPDLRDIKELYLKCL